MIAGLSPMGVLVSFLGFPMGQVSPEIKELQGTENGWQHPKGGEIGLWNADQEMEEMKEQDQGEQPGPTPVLPHKMQIPDPGVFVLAVMKVGIQFPGWIEMVQAVIFQKFPEGKEGIEPQGHRPHAVI